MKEVEIYVTAIGEKFNFMLDENTTLSMLAEEASSVVAQREQCDIKIGEDIPMFYSRERSQLLDGGKTLSQLNIKAGELLYLV